MRVPERSHTFLSASAGVRAVLRDVRGLIEDKFSRGRTGAHCIATGAECHVDMRIQIRAAICAFCATVFHGRRASHQTKSPFVVLGGFIRVARFAGFVEKHLNTQCTGSLISLAQPHFFVKRQVGQGRGFW